MVQQHDDEPRATPGSQPLVLPNWTEKGDFTGETFTALVLQGRSVRQSLFSGTLFRDCHFQRCDFSRSDFEAAVFESCTFSDCDFSVADFRSTEAVRTTFDGCSFQRGSSRAGRYVGCSFRNCSFESQTFEDNDFQDTSLIECNFQQATILHCRFDKTLFERTDLSDCTSQYHFFKDCRFDGCGFNAESVGLTFGLSIENLTSLTLVWRGTVLQHASGPLLVNDLVTTYDARRWPFAAAVTRLNFTPSNPADLTDQLFASVHQHANGRRAVGSDELKFLSRVVETLYDQSRLPFLSIARGFEAMNAIADGAPRQVRDSLKELLHVLQDAEQAELAGMEALIGPLEPMAPTDQLVVSFVFETEPTISFNGWLAGLHQIGALPGPAPKLFRTGAGSYVEVLYLSVATLSSVLICLSMIERIVERVTYIRARAKVLFSPQLPAVVQRRALQPTAAPSVTVTKELQKYLELASGHRSKRIVSDLEQFTPKLLRIEVDQEGQRSVD